MGYPHRAILCSCKHPVPLFWPEDERRRQGMSFAVERRFRGGNGRFNRVTISRAALSRVSCVARRALFAIVLDRSWVPDGPLLAVLRRLQQCNRCDVLTGDRAHQRGRVPEILTFGSVAAVCPAFFDIEFAVGHCQPRRLTMPHALLLGAERARYVGTNLCLGGQCLVCGSVEPRLQ